IIYIMMLLVVVNCISFRTFETFAAPNYGCWSFYIAPDFYTSGTTSYADIYNFTLANDFSQKSTSGGIMVSTSKSYTTDRHWSSYIETFPNDKMKEIHFATGLYQNIAQATTVCFSVPTSGYYNIFCNLINKGLEGSFGNGNKARVSVIPKNEQMETKDNCVDFDVANLGESGKNIGKYDSEVKYLNQGDKIFLRVFSGTAFAGDDIYGSYKITHLDYTDTKSAVYDLNKIGITNVEYIEHSSDYLTDEIVTATNDIESQNSNIVENWSFYKTDNFYLNTQNTLQYGYRDTRNFAPLCKKYYTESQKGIVFSTSDQTDISDRNWVSYLQVQPNSVNGKTRFALTGTNYITNEGVTVCFTIPKSGIYDINCDVENIGKSDNVGQGTGNYSRVSIIKKDECMETAENSYDFEIRNTDNSRGTGFYNSGVVQLEKNDKVYLSTYCGVDNYGDDFYGKFTVDEVDIKGNIIQKYDLNNIGISKAGNWKFYRANQAEKDSDNYTRMFAANPKWIDRELNYLGYVAPVLGDNKRCFEDMAGTPSVKWNNNSEFVTVQTGEQDIFIGWVAPKTGTFHIIVDAKGNAIIDGVTTTEQPQRIVNRVVNLQESEKILIRISKNVQIATTDIKIAVSDKTCRESEDIKEFINVMDYGASGDGVTDDTTALKNAVLDAKKYNKDIYIPTGTFLHTECIVADGIVMFGDGAAYSCLKSTAYESGESVILTGANPAIYDIRLVGPDGNRTDSTFANGIYVNRAENFTVANCKTELFSSCGIMVEKSSNGKILNNFVEKPRADGIHVVKGAVNVEVAYNTVYFSGDDGISFTSYAKDGENLTDQVHYIKCHDNTIYSNPGSRGITVNGGHSMKIFNNFTNSGQCAVTIGANKSWNSTQNQDIELYNNTFKNSFANNDNSGGAIVLLNDNKGISNNINIFSNDVYNPLRYGVLVSGTDAINAKSFWNRCYFDFDAGVTLKNQSTGLVNVKEYENEVYGVSEYVFPKNIEKKDIGNIFKYSPSGNIRNDVRLKNPLESKDASPWSFYATAGYYPLMDNPKGSGLDYGDVSDNAYYMPCTPQIYYNSGVQSRKIRVIVSPSERYGDQDAFLLFDESLQSKNQVNFGVNAAEKTRKKRGQMVVCFKAPERGSYNINANFINKGSVVEGVLKYGDGGKVRVSILKNGEKFESTQNSEEFSILDGKEKIYNKKDIILEKDDRVYFKLGTNTSNVNDDFYGNIKIENVENSVIKETYDLSKFINVINPKTS
ncbi:MAG: glycosyl hydrolase family 28-related protein, partial [Oscillospiraceae bacterium]